ncbi:MAG: hypothetical protein OXK81_07795 [Chloroflexota bacterium]|nr:hypothetical protein [Chloroflexota bacterium]MDE2929973.1 hypothetical protein [Chloroflexota bacterium]
MAVFDTHKAVKASSTKSALTSAGFPDHQAEALVDVVGEEREALATKDGLEALGSALRTEMQALRTEMQALEARVDARFEALEKAVSECATKAELREMELRMRLIPGTYVFAAAGLVITVMIGLELWPR